uniref:Uncharacterized protein n=1 Tax=Setaria digitata TaxID=48799 RepID=A0A915PTE6_9BILA
MVVCNCVSTDYKLIRSTNWCHQETEELKPESSTLHLQVSELEVRGWVDVGRGRVGNGIRTSVTGGLLF